MAKRGIKVEGLGDLLLAAEAFRAGTGVRVVRPILLHGAEIIASAVKRHVPVRTGKMRDSVRPVLARRDTVAAAFVAFQIAGKSKASRYPYIVESGSAPHAIVARGGRILKFGAAFAKGVQHPGARGIRSFTKGLRDSRGNAEAQMVAEVQPMIREAAGKAGWEYRP